MYKHLFVPVDGSELSRRSMEGSIELAQQLGARITGFVVEPDVPLTAATSHTEPLLDRIKDNEAQNEVHAAALLGQFEQRAVAAGVAFTAHHVTAYRVSHSIVEEAEKSGCDMIVMVTEGRSRVGKFIFGSHTKDVIIESSLPVLVLRK
jgi:nucleotide-binding universal stress UspA family protein